MVIDFHVHCFPDELAFKAISLLSEKGNIPAKLDGTIKSLKESMKNSGIDSSVILSIATKPNQTQKVNSWAASIQDEQVIAFGSIHPEFEGWKDELGRIKQLGLKGIKFHPEYQCFFVDEKRMLKIYEYAFELGLIVVFHSGCDLGFSPPVHCTPERLSKIVKHFPNSKIIAAHFGGYLYWDDVEKYLVGENLFFDTSYSLNWISGEQAERIIRNHGYHKILFATDSPWTDQSENVQKLKMLKLGSDIESAILGGNARGLLNI